MHEEKYWMVTKGISKEFSVQLDTAEKWEMYEREMSGRALKLLEIFEVRKGQK